MGVGGYRPFRGAVISSVTVNALTQAHVGTPYTATATSVLVDPDDGSYTKVWSMTAAGGALGLSINASTGAITGTPTAAGSYTVTQSVTDSAGTNKTGSTTLTVSATAALAADGEKVVLGSHYQAVTTATETPKAEKKVKKAKGE